MIDLGILNYVPLAIVAIVFACRILHIGWFRYLNDEVKKE